MTIKIEPRLQARIDEKLRRGEFESLDILIQEALTFFLDFEEEMDEAEFRQTRASIDEALQRASEGDGISLGDFDRAMRTKHGISR